ncbi:MAG: Ni-sirohydrochlorin a,c-diamide synthase [Methanosarcinaceae archaeon]|jgi:cobyrinic acid a,c-diamide synthase|nr:Ni-sirohydrochlorin a,c-diamide synthase [Methanosarcinaceae archaeon]
MQKNIPRVLISADRSSSGKTVITMGILSALVKKGLKVQSFKVGLDYIDPSYHSKITERHSKNLDGYLMDEDEVLTIFSHACDGVDLAIIEGVRGLYEGFESLKDTGSTAQIAKILKCPVILVVDAKSITRSASALVMGYKTFDPEVDIQGVILNNIGSERHAKKAKEAIEHYTDIKVIGTIPRNSYMKMPMRHLGLVPSIENESINSEFKTNIKPLCKFVSDAVDIKKVLEISKIGKARIFPKNTIYPNQKKLKVTIGVALDEAFNFYYQDNIELLKLHGAEIKYFSPIHDAKIPKVDALYIGGGFPEFFAKELEANKSIRQDIKKKSKAGLPIYAECGGLMYLIKKLTNGDDAYDMVGVLPGIAFFRDKRIVSYTIGSFIKDSIIGSVKNNDTFKGHEFHAFEIKDIPNDAKFSIKLSRGIGIKDGFDGLTVNNTIGLYTHLHAVSYKPFAKYFVESSLKYNKKSA